MRSLAFLAWLHDAPRAHSLYTLIYFTAHNEAHQGLNRSLREKLAQGLNVRLCAAARCVASRVCVGVARDATLHDRGRKNTSNK